MITIIHGDDIASSRRLLQEEIRKTDLKDIITFNGVKFDLSDLIFASETDSLFFLKKIIVIENLLLGAVNKKKEAIINHLKETKNTSVSYILWEDRELGRSVIKKYFPQAKEIKCVLPQLIFRFLDSIGKEMPGKLIELFNLLLQQREIEFIYLMILRQIRFLILVKDTNQNNCGLQTWQIQKLRHQGRYF